MVHVYILSIAAALSTYLHAKAGVPASSHHGFLGILGMAMTVALRTAWVQGEIVKLKEKLSPVVTAGAGLLLALGLMGGCAGTAQLSDADFANWIKGQAEIDVSASLTLASTVDAAKAAEIKADAIAAKAILDGPIAALFSGANGSLITVSAVNSALPLFKAKIAGVKNGPAIAAAVQLALGQVLGHLQLPGAPTATLNTRTALAVSGFFAGASRGISDFTGGP